MPALLGITYGFGKALPKNNQKCLIQVMEPTQHIGLKLKKIAEDRKLKPLDVAKIFGVKAPSVYDWYEHGRIAKKHYPKLVEWSGRPIDWWLDFPMQAPPQAQHQVNNEGPALYPVTTTNNWPFSTVDQRAWMTLSQEDRDHFEGMILLAITRAAQTRTGT